MSSNQNDWAGINGLNSVKPLTKARKNTVEDYLSERRTTFGFIIAAFCVLFSGFVGGVMVGESKETNKHLKKIYCKLDSVSVSSEKFKELYRVQRSADLHLQNQYLKQFAKTDSLLFTLARRKRR